MTTKKKISAKIVISKLMGPVTFGEMLSSYRESREMSQIQMSKELDISKQDLCNIEKGRKIVSVVRAASFAKALGMPVKTFAKYALQDQLLRAGISGEVFIQKAA
jgi:transcriptional regulator with XRE-family HTH domain